MEYDPRDGERYRRRIKKHRDYQSDYRDRQKEAGAPDRDDVAGAALRLLLGSAAHNPDAANKWIPCVVEDLAARKFSAEVVEKSIRAMIERHSRSPRRRRR